MLDQGSSIEVLRDLDALQDVIDMVKMGQKKVLATHLPPTRLKGKQINGQDATDLGTEAILYMRQFMQNKELPKELEKKILKA